MSKKMKTIALIAHDARKDDMVSFVKDNMEILKKMNLVATGTTGRRIKDTPSRTAAARKSTAPAVSIMAGSPREPQEPASQTLPARHGFQGPQTCR